MKKSLCIFDFDGTLVHSMEYFAKLASQLMTQTYPISKTEAHQAYLQTSGLPFFEQLEILFPKNENNPHVAKAFEEKKQSHYLNQTFFHEVPEVIQTLKTQGILTVVSSNNHQELLETYLKNQQEPCTSFHEVLGYRSGFYKGDDHFNWLMKKFNIPHEATVFIGDSLTDAHKAISFGFDFIAREGTLKAHELHQAYPQVPVIQDLRELANYLT